MKIDTVITLDSNENYLLLLNKKVENESYFLSVLVDSKNEPTNKYLILKEVIKDDETYIQKISNPILMSRLIEEYKNIYDSNYKVQKKELADEFFYSTVTDFARFLGLSIEQPLFKAILYAMI